MTETYHDPSRLFSIEVPDGFTRDESAKSLVFRHGDIDGALTVSCLRHDGDKGDVDIFEALPSRDTMQNVSRSTDGGLNISYGDYEGELQNQPEFWRWWTLQRGDVGVVVSFNGSPGDGREKAPMVDEFVRGIEIAGVPPISATDFTQRAADVYAETLGQARPDITGPLDLKGEGDARLRLDNAYINYLEHWDEDPHADPDELLTEWFEHLWGEPAEKLGPFEDIRGLIYPIVRAAGYGQETKVPVLRRTILKDELELFAAVDTGRTLRMVSENDLADWEGVDAEEVFFYARENLQALAQEMELQALAGPDGEPRAIIIAQGDSYDASRLMLPELYSKLSEVLGKNLLVGVPNRDFMIVLTADDAELVENVGNQVKIDSETRPYPISGKLYKLTPEGVEHRD